MFLHLLAKNQGKVEDVAGNYCQKRRQKGDLEDLCHASAHEFTFVYQSSHQYSTDADRCVAVMAAVIQNAYQNEARYIAQFTELSAYLAKEWSQLRLKIAAKDQSVLVNQHHQVHKIVQNRLQHAQKDKSEC